MKNGLTAYVAGITGVGSDGDPRQILVRDVADAAASAVTKGLTDIIDAVCQQQSLDNVCDNLAFISSLTGALGNGLRTASWLAPPLRLFAEGLLYISLVAQTAETLLEALGFCDDHPAEPDDPTKNPPTSPLIIDLNGDGVQTTSLQQSAVFFDLNGDGFAQNTAWVSPEDGLLVLDRNANGSIDNITELFGSSTQDGFTQLRALDDNGDGVIDTADAAFNDLRVWIDANSDGISQSDELKTLVELGITVIDATAAIVNAQNSGNPVTHESSATTNDGATLQVLDVWFRNSAVNTKFILPDGYDYAPDALILPQLQGYGRIADLRYGMSENDLLRTAVSDLIANVNGMTGAEFRTSFEAIFQQWAGVEAIDPASRGEYVDARHLVLLERMFASDFLQTLGTNAGTPDPGPNAGFDLEQSYQDLLDSMMSRFAVQIYVSQLRAFDGSGTEPQAADIAVMQAALDSPFRNLSDLFYNQDVNRLTTRDVDAALHTALGNLPADSVQAIAQMDLLMTVLSGLRVDLFGGSETAFRGALTGVLGQIDDLALRELVLARAGTLDELTSGTAGADALAIADIAYRPDSDQLRPDANGIWGREGNDTLSGGFGGDSYIFTAGDGTDVVDDRGSADHLQVDDWGIFVNFGGTDQLLFVGRSSKDASFTRDGVNLVISFTDGSGDKVTVSGQFAVDEAGHIEQLVFADQVVGQSNLEALFASQTATSGADDILGSAQQGDVIIGGLGNDTLNGRGGDDVYRYSAGDGHDIIIDRGADNADELSLVDITPENVIVQRDGLDVLIVVTDPLNGGAATGSIRLVGEFSGDGASGVERISFAGGAIWSVTDLVIKAGGGLPQGPAILGMAAGEQLDGTSGNDILDGGAGDDTINPGAGTDIIRFGLHAGRDVLHVARSDRFGDATIVQVDALTDHLALSRSGNDLLIELLQDVTLPDGSPGLQASGDSLTVAGHFLGDSSAIDRLLLADGTHLDINAINSLAVPDTSALHLSGVTLADLTFERVDAAAEQIQANGLGNTDLTISANGVVLAHVANQFYQFPDGNGGTVRFGLERFTLDDGSIFDRAGLAQLAPLLGSSFDDNGGISGVDNLVHRPLLGTEFSESLSGFAGDDVLRGGAGDDSLTGGTGDDLLFGDGDSGQPVGAPREGSDSYFYASGDGSDRIFDFGSGGVDVDRLIFSDINRADVELTRVSTPAAGNPIEGGSADLVITIAGSGEMISVSQQFVNEFYGLEEIRFADGTVLDRSAFFEIAPLVGTAQQDVIQGSGVIRPGLGDDVIYGVTLPGHSNILDYRAGDGNDELHDVGVIRLGDLNAGDLRLVREGSDLRINILSTGESILVVDQFPAPSGSGIGGGDSGGSGGGGDPLGGSGGLPGGGGGALPGDPGGTLPGGGGAGGGTTASFTPPLVEIQFKDGEIWDQQRIETEAVVSGGAGNDLIEGSEAGDQIAAGSGNDSVSGFGGDDLIIGGGGNDSLNGGSGLDHFFASSEAAGLAGPVGSDGNDTIDGGLDDDRYDATAINSAVTIDLAAGTATGTDIGNDVLISIEEAYGGSGNDTISGDDGRNILSGGPGDDVLSGAGGFDLLIGGAGADRLIGGDGRDVAIYGQSLAGVEIDLQSGNGHGGHAEGDQLTGVEDVTGSNYDDLLYGDGNANDLELGRGDDTAFGRDGNDTINGEGGNDTINGGTGNDHLTGEGGDDDIRGDAGSDVMDGGFGNDILAGGAGSDTYVWFDGAGLDRLQEGASSTDEIDQLNIFGLVLSDLVFSRRADDLLITSKGGDELVITGQFSGIDGTGVEFIDLVDGGLILGSAEIAQLSVVGQNAAPFAVDDNLATPVDTQLLVSSQNVLANDLDLDQDELHVLSVSDTADGTVELLANGSISFTPQAGFSGETSFTYTIGDGAGGEATARVIVNVGPVAIQGGSGNDILLGTAGDDSINGGGGNDRLRGGAGADRIDGGSGHDQFVFLSGFGHDVLLDFDVTEDILVLSRDLLAPGETIDQVIASATEVNGEAFVSFDVENSITLNGVDIATLGVDDFRLV